MNFTLVTAYRNGTYCAIKEHDLKLVYDLLQLADQSRQMQTRRQQKHRCRQESLICRLSRYSEPRLYQLIQEVQRG